MSYRRPEILRGFTRTINVGCGKLHITLNYRIDKRFEQPPLNEIFIKPDFPYKDKDEITAYCVNSFLQPLARILTWNLRRLKKEDRASFIKQFLIKNDAGCPRKSIATARSCMDGVARVILCYWNGHKIKEGRCYVCGLRV